MKILVFLFILINSVIFTFAVPPFQKADEIAHFYSAVGLSSGQLFCHPNQKGVKVLSIPKRLYMLPGFFRAKEISHNYNEKFSFNRTDLEKYLADTDSSNVETSESCISYFAGYIPNAIGLISVSSLKNPLVEFYSGRISGLLFFLVCFFYALKIIPKPFHIILYLYGTLPMVLHQVTSYSYDVFLLSMTPLVFAYFVKVYVQKTSTWRDFFHYQLGVILFVIGKPISFPFIFLHLLFPFSKGPWRKSALLILSLIFFLVSILLNLLLLRQ